MERYMIRKFRAKLQGKAFCYHTKANRYGEQGFPDLIVIYESNTYFVEVKDFDTLELAIKHLSGTQKAMIKKIWNQGKVKVILFYNKGFAIYNELTLNDVHWEDFPNSSLVGYILRD